MGERWVIGAAPPGGDPPEAQGDGPLHTAPLPRVGLAPGTMEAVFGALWGGATEPMLVVDGPGRVLWRNPSAERLAPVDTLAELLPPVDARAEPADVGLEPRVTLREGRQARLHRTPLADPPGGALVVLRDITAWQRLEGELQAARQAAGVAQLALAVAHEINNPLAVVLGRIELLGAVEGPAHAALGPHLEVMGTHARHIAGNLRSLQALSRPTGGGCGEHPVAALLQRAAELVGRRMGEMSTVLQLEPPDLKVVGDRTQLEQALYSLLAHVAAGMHRRGAVEVHGWEEGERTCVELRDFGVSPPRGVSELLAQPHAPMELLAAGVALGVLVARELLQQQGGGLTVRVEGGRGARYLVELPRTRARRGGLPLVLVVDPAGSLAARVRSALVGEAAMVQEVGSGQEATRALESCPVALVLVPHELPGQSGLALRRALVRRHAGLEARVVVVVPPERVSSVAGAPVLVEPVGRAALAEVLRRVGAPG